MRLLSSARPPGTLGMLGALGWIGLGLLGAEPVEPRSDDLRTASAVSQPGGVRVGPVGAIPTRFVDLPVVEPHVAAHPTDPLTLLVGAMVVTDVDHPYRSSRLSTFHTGDGGTTWTETAHDWWGYDPWVELLPGDRAVLAWIGNPRRFRDSYPVQWFASEDSGANWAARVQRGAGNHDGTKFASRNGQVWFTTVRFRPHDPADGHSMAADVVLFRRGEDGDFAEVAVVDGGGDRLGFCQPGVLGDGRVLVPASRRDEAWVQVWDPTRKELGPPRRITDRPGGRRGYPHLVVDAGVDSPFRDRAYYVRALTTEEGGGVRVDLSSDGGEEWREGGRVDRFETEGSSLPMVATAAVNESGAVAVTWIDRRGRPESNANDLYVAASLDGGETFGKPVRVTATGNDPATDANGVAAERFPGGGHYLGLAARADGRFQAVWADSSEGPFGLRTATIEVPAGDGVRE